MKNLFKLRILFIPLFVFLLVSCGKKEAERSASQSKQSKKSFSRGSYEATQELKKFAEEKGLLEDPRVKASNDAYFAVYREFTKTRKSHPDLIPFFEKSDALENLAINSKMAKDEGAYKQAMEDYKTLRTELERAAGKIPEVREIQKQLSLMQEKQTQVLCDVVAESGAEGKKLADNVRKLSR